MKFFWLYRESEHSFDQAANFPKVRFYQKPIADQLIEKRETLVNFAKCKELEPGHYDQTVFQYSAHIVKTEVALFIVICDQPLTRSNLVYLAFNLFNRNKNLADVIATPENYVKDPKIEAVRIQADDAKKALLAAYDSVLDRGEQIEKTLERTRDLRDNCREFKIASEELNSCWPKCSIL